MERTLKQTPVNDHEFLYEVVISSDPCPAKTLVARNAIQSLLRTCLNTPGLLDCGSNAFDTVKISHDGDKWKIVLEAVGP